MFQDAEEDHDSGSKESFNERGDVGGDYFSANSLSFTTNHYPYSDTTLLKRTILAISLCIFKAKMLEQGDRIL